MTIQELVENEQDAIRRTMAVLMLVRFAGVEHGEHEVVSYVESTSIALGNLFDWVGLDGRAELIAAQQEAAQWLDDARASFIEGEVVSVQ